MIKKSPKIIKSWNYWLKKWLDTVPRGPWGDEEGWIRIKREKWYNIYKEMPLADRIFYQHLMPPKQILLVPSMIGTWMKQRKIKKIT